MSTTNPVSQPSSSRLLTFNNSQSSVVNGADEKDSAKSKKVFQLISPLVREIVVFIGHPLSTIGINRQFREITCSSLTRYATPALNFPLQFPDGNWIQGFKEANARFRALKEEAKSPLLDFYDLKWAWDDRGCTSFHATLKLEILVRNVRLWNTLEASATPGIVKKFKEEMKIKKGSNFLRLDNPELESFVAKLQAFKAIARLWNQKRTCFDIIGIHEDISLERTRHNGTFPEDVIDAETFKRFEMYNAMSLGGTHFPLEISVIPLKILQISTQFKAPIPKEIRDFRAQKLEVFTPCLPLPCEIWKIKGLQKVKINPISFNGFAEIPNPTEEVPGVTELYLREVSLKNFRFDLFPNLTTLKIIQSDIDAFPSAKNVEILEMTTTQISDIPDDFLECFPNLKSLILVNNCFKSKPKIFEDAKFNGIKINFFEPKGGKV